MLSKLNASIQALLPQHFLSKLMFAITRCTFPPWKSFFIRCFIRLYKVDMSIAENPQASSYEHFNAFFTRALNSNSRPVDNTTSGIASPVDGSISQLGNIQDKSILQAKGKDYALDALLAGEEQLASYFRHGSFATIYLSPKDYHRIHLPLDCKLTDMIYVPGDLYSVNEATTSSVDNLFARNERVICLFESEFGMMCVIMVGAIFVGSMDTVWEGEITPAKVRELRSWHYEGENQPSFSKGDEMGRFNMGSTVIMLFQDDHVSWLDELSAGHNLKMGQLIGTGK